jgi:hypothetical protein
MHLAAKGKSATIGIGRERIGGEGKVSDNRNRTREDWMAFASSDSREG